MLTMTVPASARRILLLAAVLFVGGALAAIARQSAPSIDNPTPNLSSKLVDAAEAKQLIADKKVVVLDVRTPAEFAAGHIAGAVNLDFRDKEFASKVARLDKNQPYLVHCAVGSRSAKACQTMVPLQFKTLYDLKGGISGWQKAGFPVEK
jgi:rhodanese-related sulfurtransferase